VARMSAATAAEAGVADGDKVTIATDRGSVTVPVDVVPMADRVVWVPATGLPGQRSTIRAELGAGHGSTVTLRRPE
jgi:NADH-quinone oxidoreductase subunit G